MSTWVVLFQNVYYLYEVYTTEVCDLRDNKRVIAFISLCSCCLCPGGPPFTWDDHHLCEGRNPIQFPEQLKRLAPVLTSHAIHVAKPHSFGSLIGFSTGFLNNIIIEKMTNWQRVSAYWAYMWQRKLQYCFKCFTLMLNCRGIFSLFFILVFITAQCPWLDSTLL